jgi:hypothetical protein
MDEASKRPQRAESSKNKAWVVRLSNQRIQAIMKTLSTVIAASLLSAGVLIADVALAAGVAPKTRADVVAELIQARNSGELARLNSEDTALFLQNRGGVAMPKTRAQVLAELRQAQESGELAQFNTDDTAASLNADAKKRLAKTKQGGVSSAE